MEPQESLACTPHYYVYALEYKDRQYTALACVYSTQLLYIPRYSLHTVTIITYTYVSEFVQWCSRPGQYM